MTQWLIHPIGQLTNHEVSRRLAERGQGSNPSFSIERRAVDGKSYDVIEVDYRLLREMYEATTKRGGDFNFLPFKAEGSKAEMEFVPEFLLKRHRSKKVREALEFVEKQRGWKSASH